MLIPKISSRVKAAAMSQDLANQPFQVRPVAPPPDPLIVDEQALMQGENLIDSVNLKAQAPEVGPATAETGNEPSILSFITGSLGQVFSSMSEGMKKEKTGNDLMDFISKTAGVDRRGLPRG